MGHKKLERFAAIKEFVNVLERPEQMQGKWSAFFGNTNPITLELACGKGEYTLGLARLHPDRNFIGADIKGNRIWKGAKTALEDDLKNVAFLRIQIEQLAEYFSENEVADIWITFPDPQLRLSRMKKRLTHPKFLRQYQKVLQPNGMIHLKTDSPDLFYFTKEVIKFFEFSLLKEDDDIYAHQPVAPELSIKTHYEGLDISGSEQVHYLEFKTDRPIPIEKEAAFKESILKKVSQ